MTKDQSAQLTVQTMLVESGEQTMHFYPEGARFAIPNTNKLIMVGTADWIAANVASLASQPQAESARPTDDELWDETLRDRDCYHDWADKLAEAISKHFDAYIGEHSNTNCPWAEALEAIESAAPMGREAQAELQALRQRVGQLEAARMAYASEFPLNADGEPDVGNIHANIRALKATVAQGEQADEVRDAAQDWAEADRIANAPIVDDALRGFSEDPTGDNGVCVVLAVLDAIKRAGDTGEQADGGEG